MISELESLTNESLEFEKELYRIIVGPVAVYSARYNISDILCDLSFEHWGGCRGLMFNEFVNPSFVVLRSQFESLIRSIWLLHSATEHQVQRLNQGLTIETEQAAKNLPSIHDMMKRLKVDAPQNAFLPLNELTEHVLRSLNSYTHGGIHPVSRIRAGGWSIRQLEEVIKLSNGLGALAGFQAVVLRGNQPLQKDIIELAQKYIHCFKPKE